MIKNKVSSISNVLPHIQNGSVLMVGGFGLVGSPLSVVHYLGDYDVTDLTVISNNVGEEGRGLGKLLQQGKIKKVIGSYFTSNRDVAKYMKDGKLEVELLPQGTLAEAIRSGGAGIGGFYTKTGVGTKIAEGKDTKIIRGEQYLFQESIIADVALIRAYKADKLGNLIYYKTARNFNPDMAMAAKYVIAEVDEIVEVGEIPPDEIVTPHLYVDAIVKSEFNLTLNGVVGRD